jgi:TRIAD3 protein (E3 ubiquitin-protein ligase RNF216)
MAKAKSDNPGMTDADLMIEVSDRVKRLEEARRGQAQAQHAAFPWHMQGGELVNGPAPAPVPQLPRYDFHWNAENMFAADFDYQFPFPFPAPQPQ